MEIQQVKLNSYWCVVSSSDRRTHRARRSRSPVADASDPDAPPALQARERHRPKDFCGTRQVRRPGVAPQNQHVGFPERIIYLNRNGGTYQVTGTATNAATNVASASWLSDGQPVVAVIEPMAADFNWPMIAACVADHFALYRVQVVETEPATGTFIEAVVGGTGTELGYGVNELWGIATRRQLLWRDRSRHRVHLPRGTPRRRAPGRGAVRDDFHEVAHLLALEHETLPTDLMSYTIIADSMYKDFVDENATCGVYLELRQGLAPARPAPPTRRRGWPPSSAYGPPSSTSRRPLS